MSVTLPPPQLSQSARVDPQSIQPFPRSRKIHVQGSRPDIRVPMREIALDVTPTALGGEVNPPVTVYDTSGPYTDPEVRIDVRQGLPDVRGGWIKERGDTERLPGLSSEFGRRRLADPALAALRFAHVRNPRRARAGHNALFAIFRDHCAPLLLQRAQGGPASTEALCIRLVHPCDNPQCDTAHELLCMNSAATLLARAHAVQAPPAPAAPPSPSDASGDGPGPTDDAGPPALRPGRGEGPTA